MSKIISIKAELEYASKLGIFALGNLESIARTNGLEYELGNTYDLQFDFVVRRIFAGGKWTNFIIKDIDNQIFDFPLKDTIKEVDELSRKLGYPPFTGPIF